MKTNVVISSAALPPQRTSQKSNQQMRFSGNEISALPQIVEQEKETESTVTKSWIKKNGNVNSFKSEAPGHKASKAFLLFLVPMGLSLAAGIYQMASFRKIGQQLSQRNKIASKALEASMMPKGPLLEGWRKYEDYAGKILPYLNTVFLGTIMVKEVRKP